jgi:hypothetical protein
MDPIMVASRDRPPITVGTMIESMIGVDFVIDPLVIDP